jgi:hypothetical protein
MAQPTGRDQIARRPARQDDSIEHPPEIVEQAADLGRQRLDRTLGDVFVTASSRSPTTWSG